MAAADCGKIYLMLGVNELGWNGTDIFREHAEALLQRLRADHPDAELVIQSLLPVTAAQLAEEYGCAYVNVAEAVTGADGCLPEEMSFDGIHLNRAGCRVWLDYLRTHSVGQGTEREQTDETGV